MRLLSFTLFIILFLGCKTEKSPQNQYFEAENELFTYSGRTLASGEGMELITSAASVKAEVYGDTVTIFLKSKEEEHHYVAVELNDEYKGRFRIIKDTLKFALPNRDSANTLTIYKETEAANGALIFSGLRAQRMEKSPDTQRAKIEFIGDSITCGMGADATKMECGTGEWFDQHSAYLSYGPRVARLLDVDYEVNCVSGMGMYRNWNDNDEPVMPEVYPYLHLNGNHGKRMVFNKEDPPQVVSIALGTNDFSLGDREKMRMPFSADKFKENYIKFVKSIFELYPETRVALLSSPMTKEEDSKELFKILQEIKDQLKDHPIEIFEFQKRYTGGCAGHPDIKDHEQMAEQLVPFYRKMLSKV